MKTLLILALALLARMVHAQTPVEVDFIYDLTPAGSTQYVNGGALHEFSFGQFLVGLGDDGVTLHTPGIIQPDALKGPLPVTLVSFAVQKEAGNAAIVSWETVFETMSAHFEIERSGDAMHWQQIGVLPAAGESTDLLKYTFTDEAPIQSAGPEGVVYYRLRMVDTDGTFAYSAIRSVRFDASDQLVLYPQPAADVLHYRFHSTGLTIGNVLTVNGQRVEAGRGDGGRIDVSALLPGTYLLEVRSAREVVAYRRFVKK